MADATVLRPALPAVSGVAVLSTTRSGGASADPYRSWNLGNHVGDDALNVASNRARLQALLPGGTDICWLQQVHGASVVHAAGGQGAKADAVWTDDPAHACAVMTADCLPVVLASRDGSCCAVAHGGWRGLASGVLAQTVEALPVSPEALVAWLGPAIGPRAFEVGADVREAFSSTSTAASTAMIGPEAAGAFTPSGNPDKWLCDLYALARRQLAALGVRRVAGGDRCTFSEPGQFFSHRRDGLTGRMATVAWLT